MTTTRTEAPPVVSPDVGAYLLLKGGLVCVLDTAGDKALYQLGAVCSFNLCVDFTGNRYMYFGNFAKLSPSVIAWRINKLIQIFDERIAGIDFRVQSGLVTATQRDLFLQLRKTVEIWILVKDAEARDALLKAVSGCSIEPDVFTLADVESEVSKSGMM